MTKMISVITPVYNGEKFIESCIKNVIEQACPYVEHIIIDGASTDNTVKIVKEYAENNSHIRWLSEKDRGQSDAMNKGITMANGKIIAILNVDDFYEPNVLNHILEIFQALPEPSLLVGNCNVWDDFNNLKEVNKPQKMRFTELLLGWEINPIPANPSAYFYHKCLHSKVGLYELDEHYMMDYDFILKAVQCATVEYVDETWGNFRYIKGTKTFDDTEIGESAKRRKLVIQKYVKTLPLLQQQKINLYISFFQVIILAQKIRDFAVIRIKYFSRHPAELTTSILAKLKR